MPEEVVTASNTMNVATVSSVAKPVDTTPKAPVENKVYSPETDNQFSAAEMESLINKAKEPKVETPVVAKTETPEKPVEPPVSDTPKSVPTETAKPVAEDMKSIISSAIEEKFKELGVEKGEVAEKPEDKFFGFKTQEEYDAAYAENPQAVTKKILESQFGDMIKKSIAEQIEPFKQQIAPVTDKIVNEQIANHRAEAESLVPELKDPKSLMSQDFEKFITDKDNHDLINKWASKGKNPLAEVAKLVRAERIHDYVDQAKQQGFKEGEEKALKAERASVEGGGKGAIEENMTVEKFDKMSSADQEKFLISKGAIRR
jgi:hypothetical protein